jgi:lipopolysaccharide export LptBFGC system permease protein LptF
MDNLARLQQARREVVKVQRRMWLVQAIFWPAVVLLFVLIAVVGVRWLQRRRRAVAASATPTRPPADDAQAS